MFWHRHIGPPRGSRGPAFTLIEIVVALTIIAVIAAIAIPTIKGLGREEKARAPVAALAALVQEVRQRAVKERRPYQIVFERGGIHGLADGFPSGKREDFLAALDEARTPPLGQEIERTEPVTTAVETAGPAGPAPAGMAGQPPSAEGTPPPATPSPATSPRWEPPWSVSIALEEKTDCEVLFWGDGEWDLLEGDDLRRWVFQPSGLASPGRVRVRTAAVEVEAGFDALTGELVRERIEFLDSQP